MLPSIPALLTPAMLAITPSSTSMPQPEYQWQAQTSIIQEAGEAEPTSWGNHTTMSGTQSYPNGCQAIIDDWRQD